MGSTRITFRKKAASQFHSGSSDFWNILYLQSMEVDLPSFLQFPLFSNQSVILHYTDYFMTLYYAAEFF